jgi:hypothetical protein
VSSPAAKVTAQTKIASPATLRSRPIENDVIV